MGPLIASVIGIFTLCGAAQAPAEAATSDPRRDATVLAIQRVLPSVVNISTETVLTIHDPVEQMFREFFDPYYRQRPHAQRSLGSGIIIDEEGFILTNYHVVRRASRIMVTIWDGREFTALPVVAVAGIDIALLRIENPEDAKFEAIPFAAPDDLLLGETVIALGNPFGLGESVSRGILSSKARREAAPGEPLSIADWLQTDAAINPGNSGGPLVNLNGQLIGLNVAIYREAQGIGFAIPVRRLAEALSLMFTPENIQGLWFGANLASAPDGFLVEAVEEGSPAEKGGLRKGDLVQTVGGKHPSNVVELTRLLVAAGTNANVTLSGRRLGEPVKATVGLLPLETQFNAALLMRRAGFSAQELVPALAAALGFAPHYRGIVVSEVDRSGPAARASLRQGDLIQSIDGSPVTSILEAAKALYPKKKGETVQAGILAQRRRGGYAGMYRGMAEITLR